jgi:ATP-dependent Zn protease
MDAGPGDEVEASVMARGPELEPLRLAAYHEAGHAVMAQLCGQQVTEVEIVGDDELSGSVRSLRFADERLSRIDSELPTAPVERRLLCTLAGMVAESVAGGGDHWDEGSEDLDAAVRLAMQVVVDCERVVPFLELAREHVEDLLLQHWPAVETLAGRLIDRRRLNGEDVRRLLTDLLPD